MSWEKFAFSYHSVSISLILDVVRRVVRKGISYIFTLYDETCDEGTFWMWQQVLVSSFIKLLYRT